MAEERGLRIGSFAGAPIVVDRSIVLLIAYVLGMAVLQGGVGAITSALIFLAAIMLAVLIHEFGHAGIAALLKLRSKRIVLTFFGGHVEFAEQPRSRWQEIAVSAAGPLANLGCWAAATVFLPDLYFTSGPSWLWLIDQFATLSLLLGVFNLLPGFPLDGGRILRAALAYVMPRSRAFLIAAWIGLLIAGALAAYAIWGQLWWTLFIAALLALSAWAEIQRARAELQSNATSNA